MSLAATMGDVIIEASGSILIDPGSDIAYNSGNQLSLLAQQNIVIQSNILNSGAGAINLVAGYDGSTGLSGGSFTATTAAVTAGSTFTMASVFALPTSYGQFNGGIHGSVTIGNSADFGPIAVASAGGPTTVAAYDLTVQGSAGFELSAQLGYNPLNYSGPSPTTTTTGPITVQLNDNLTLVGGGCGGDCTMSFAQIGHGGASTAGSFGGAITVNVAGSIGLSGGADDQSYAQIGNGGEAFQGTATSPITVTALGNLTLTGGSGDAYAQIGHGGAFSNEGANTASIVGDTINIAAQTVLLRGGSGAGAYAQIGNGGIAYGASASLSSGSLGLSGDISVGASTGLTLQPAMAAA